MRYTTKMLAKLGRIVIKKHPDIATCILDQWRISEVVDLAKIPSYFVLYCDILGIEPEKIKGPVYKSSLTEVKKVFIAAMINIYQDQYLFNKTISDTLIQHPYSTSKMVTEANFRYKKEPDFTRRVDNILNKINKSL